MKRILYVFAIAVVFAGGFGAGNYYNLPSFGVDTKQSDLPVAAQERGETNIFSIKTKSKTFFLQDEKGGLVPEEVNGKRYFKPGEDIYENIRVIVSNRTALIVMDPWEDGGSEFLNKYYGPVYRQRILPLVNTALMLKIPVIILTNDPKKNYADYGSDVYPELRLLADNGKAQIIFHQDFNDDSFAEYLKEKSIDTLIYSGFASNMCVIGRALGMIPMQTHGFKLFFVPEASAALEFKDSWKTGAVHKATTEIISQSVGELIDFEEFMNLVPGKDAGDGVAKSSTGSEKYQGSSKMVSQPQPARQ